MPRFTTPWHFHPEIELIWIIESSGRRFVGNSIETFAAGDLVLIGPNVPHLWLNDADRSRWKLARAIVIKFHPGFLGPDFFSKPELLQLQRLLQESLRGLVFTGPAAKKITQAMQALPAKEGMDALLKLLFILHRLSAAPRRPLTSAGYAPSLNPEMEARVGKVYTFLMKRFREPLTLPQIARQAAMTPAAFSRFFKRVSRHNISVFLNDLRIDYASRELLQARRSITEIAFDSGFATLSSFNRRFRERRGCSPKAYQKTFEESLETSSVTVPTIVRNRRQIATSVLLPPASR